MKVSEIILYIALFVFTFTVADMIFRTSTQKQVILKLNTQPTPVIVPLEAPTAAYKRRLCKRDTECRVLSEALVYEARGESLRGAIAVGYVIVERKKSWKWPNTIRGVVNYRCHFSYKCEPPQAKPKQGDWDRAYEASFDILTNAVKNPIGEADHYLNPKVVKRLPRWAKEYEYVADVGNHRFYRSR
jgi:spore germination cell wall hydrolase CwlJ-like protein